VGAAGTIFFSSSDELQTIVLGFVLGGMGAGALVAHAPHLSSYYAYLIPSFAPITLRLALSDQGEHQVMACMCVVYVLSLMLLGRFAHTWLSRCLSLKIENGDLVQSLEVRVAERTRDLHVINGRLIQDVADRRRAEETLIEYGDRQAAVAQFGQRVLGGGDPDALFPEAVELVAKRLRVAGALILQQSSNGDALVVRTAYGMLGSLDPGTVLPGGIGSPAGFAMLLRAPVASGNLALERRFSWPPELQEAGAASAADVVITGASSAFGVLEVVDDRARQFTVDDLSFMQGIANMLASAMDRCRAEQAIQRLAMEDPLTGLPNRVVFRQRLLQDLARLPLTGRTLALMLLDLDHFKDVSIARTIIGSLAKPFFIENQEIRLIPAFIDFNRRMPNSG
jgi:hypothetical protein